MELTREDDLIEYPFMFDPKWATALQCDGETLKYEMIALHRLPEFTTHTKGFLVPAGLVLEKLHMYSDSSFKDFMRSKADGMLVTLRTNMEKFAVPGAICLRDSASSRDLRMRAQYIICLVEYHTLRFALHGVPIPFTTEAALAGSVRLPHWPDKDRPRFEKLFGDSVAQRLPASLAGCLDRQCASCGLVFDKTLAKCGKCGVSMVKDFWLLLKCANDAASYRPYCSSLCASGDTILLKNLSES